MRTLHSVKSRTKFIIATAVLNAAILAFVGDASAAGKEVTIEIGEVCVCQPSCRVFTWCLLQYCYKETVCGECSNCEYVSERTKRVPGQKLCIYRPSPHQCVTRIETRPHRFWQH
jgi:hypothetical protein